MLEIFNPREVSRWKEDGVGSEVVSAQDYDNLFDMWLGLGGDFKHPQPQFTRKPLLDRVFVQVTPLEEVFEQGSIAVDLQNEHIKLQSDRGIVLAVGDGVPMNGFMAPMPVNVGDTVFFDEFAYAGRFYLKPSDKFKADMPTYLEIRVGDLRGVEANA